ncbi:hypothetical protein [Pedobacter insulae]|uniref:hypothetical protein n=1 Tax=Pedobacter insulae TaxID=414048 RepID=UPI000B822D40|nr:hypothetical protein [Pedobacter insulae]
MSLKGSKGSRKCIFYAFAGAAGKAGEEMKWSEAHKMDDPVFPAWAATAPKTHNRSKINPVEKRGYRDRRTTAAPFRKRKLA